MRASPPPPPPGGGVSVPTHLLQPPAPHLTNTSVAQGPTEPGKETSVGTRDHGGPRLAGVNDPSVVRDRKRVLLHDAIPSLLRGTN